MQNSNSLDKVIRFKGKLGKKEAANAGEVPVNFEAYGLRYEFRKSPDGNYPQVTCDAGKVWMDMPNEALFATKLGVVFYDPSDTLDTRIMPDTDGGPEACQFGECNKDDCPYSHVQVCLKGVKCEHFGQKKGCKYSFHPPADSVVPLGLKDPLNKSCKYGTRCSGKGCKFAHPNGRMSVPRQTASVYFTHSLRLQPLSQPVPLKLDVPEDATNFSFQGEFVFFFQPYPATWAKDYYQRVMVHRFNVVNQVHQNLGDYSLDGHYCNCAAGGGRYLLLSFWPYDDGVVKTVWESLKVGRAMEKELRENKKEIKQKETENLRLQGLLKKKDLQIAKLYVEACEKDHRIQQLVKEKEALIASHSKKLADAQQELAQKELAARKLAVALAKAKAHNAAEAAEQRHRRKESRRYWLEIRISQERTRSEGWRLRDPIHVYALQTGTTGGHKEDWQLVLDYHKGAHNLKLGVVPALDGSQSLEVTEHDNVYCFDLVVPPNVRALTAQLSLPLVPKQLCDDF